MSATDLVRLITPDSAIPKGFCSASILEKIQQGGLISKRLSNRYKTALRNFLATE
jgi:hypothetical protein